MFPAPLPAVLLSLLSLLSAHLLTGAAAQSAEAVSIDFYTDVLYSPPEAWSSGINSACGGVDHWTTTINASAKITFVGDRIQVYGVQNNASGVLGMIIDDQEPQELNLWSNDVECNLYVDWFLGNGTHTLTLTLVGIDPVVSTTPLPGNEEGVTSPVLHLTDIVYYIPDVPAAAASDLASGSSHKNVAAIVAGTVCGVVGLAGLVLAALFVWKKRAARKARHAFDPNTVYITELSPRTATTPPDSAAKFGAYARFDDDHEAKPDAKSGALAVPELQYGLSPSRGGLRSRSRSPMPDRTPAP
ncbi:SKG6 domain-containing protein [Phanerochaete sordida]|uniref:SKG6 domain-containing protein n=1 Tax=Phanerochaete sordida TaxID=48140 RepID=A0A9P3GBT4_9APHY|nr:SKG6 domain-containing protein [Phanerochaete sordida]